MHVALAGRPVYRDVKTRYQLAHAPDMVAVMMRDQNRCQLEFLIVQELDNWIRITWIHNGNAFIGTLAADQPDVVVAKCVDG